MESRHGICQVKRWVQLGGLKHGDMVPPMFLQIWEKNPVNQGGFRPSTTKDQDMAGLRLGDLGDSTGWKIKESQHENVFKRIA